MEDLRDIIQREVRGVLGHLRTMASELKHDGQVEDEEEAFKALVREYAKVIKQEISKLIGPEDTGKWLDPFGR